MLSIVRGWMLATMDGFREVGKWFIVGHSKFGLAGGRGGGGL